MTGLKDIPLKCSRCRHQCMESELVAVPRKGFGRSLSVSDLRCPRCGCKSYLDMRPQFAWCFADGLVETGDQPPANQADGSGAIVLARGPKSELDLVLSITMRHGQGAARGRLIVPGVPEADTPNAKVDALIAFMGWARKRKDHKRGVLWEGQAGWGN